MACDLEQSEAMAAPVPQPASRSAALPWLALSGGGALFVTLWLGLMVLGQSAVFHDPGTFWHTVLGQRLLSTGRLATHDDFTFTFGGRPWLAVQWAGEALLAAAYNTGGWDSVLWLTSAVVAGTYTFLALRWQRATGSWPITVGLLVVVLGASAHHFHARPHLATIGLVGFTYAWLCDVEAGRRRLAHLGWLVPVFALWSNIHGGVLAGLASVGLAAIGWLTMWLLRRPSPVSGWRSVGMLVLACGLLAAAPLLNPYGPAALGVWREILLMPLPDLIQEHRPLNFTRPESWFVLLLAAGYAWALVDALRNRSAAGSGSSANSATRPKSAAWVCWLLPLVWLLLALTRVRHAPLFAMVVGVALAELLPRTRLTAWLQSVSSPRADQPPPHHAAPGRAAAGNAALASGTSRRLAVWCRAALIPAVVLAASLMLQHRGVQVPVIGAGWARLDTHHWPVELVGELREIDARGSRIFNALDYGGFVTMYAPHLKTFIDDRCELFGTQFLSEYAVAEKGRPEQIEAWHRQYGFRHALVRAGSPFAKHLAGSPNWMLIARSPAGELYQRK
jgi:hypothetical protein